MINSVIYESVVVHHLSGELTNRDMIDAKIFVQSNLAELPTDFCVLWDLREAVLMQSDDSYQRSVMAFINPSPTQSSRCKRAFLVQSDTHLDRVGSALGQSGAPWPWAVFTSFEDSVAWLKST